MKWFVTNWQMLAWITGGLFTAMVFAEEEYRDYRNMKEATLEQKRFNNEFGEKMREIEIRQERMDVSIEYIKQTMEKINEKL